MKKVKIGILFIVALFYSCFSFGQQHPGVKSYWGNSANKTIDGNAIMSFLGSEEFKLIMVLIVLVSLALWIAYTIGSLSMAKKNTSASYHSSPASSSEGLFSRNPVGHLLFNYAPQFIKGEKKDKSKSDQDRDAPNTQRG